MTLSPMTTAFGCAFSTATQRINFYLTEAKVFGQLAIGYHRTRNLKNLKAIGESGFKHSSRSLYGDGVYLTYDFEDQQDQRMLSEYGPFIIKSKVKLTNFLILDQDVAKLVYPQHYSLADQLSRLKIKLDADVKDSILKSYASGVADGLTSVCARALSRYIKVLKVYGVRGLVFTGAQDGRVIVSWFPEDVTPIGQARVVNLAKTENTVKWHKYTDVNIPTPPATLDLYSIAKRYLVAKGFEFFQSQDKSLVFQNKASQALIIVGPQIGKEFNQNADSITCWIHLLKKPVIQDQLFHRAHIVSTFGGPLIHYYPTITPIDLPTTLARITTDALAIKQTAEDYKNRNTTLAESIFRQVTLPGTEFVLAQGPQNLQKSILYSPSREIEVTFNPYQSPVTSKPSGSIILWLWEDKTSLVIGYNEDGIIFDMLSHYSMFRSDILKNKVVWPVDINPEFLDKVKHYITN